MPKVAHKLPPLPTDEPARVQLVGTTLFGANYRAPLSRALGIGRTQLWKILTGRGKRRPPIDDRLIELLDAEADGAAERGLAIAALRKRFLKERADA